MKAAENLAGAPSIEVMDMQERALNRLAGTFAAQMEALKRYRSKGEQRVYVERVTVNEGGQAIVGPVAHGRRDGAMTKMANNPMQSAHAALRCAAESKRSGMQCKAPAIKGKRVCRMHGGKSPCAPCGELHGRYVHGRQTREAKAARKEVRDLIRTVRQLAALF
ncbi:MAG TPA: HGGxSTG domain-containing protein [Mesorhizobium sp.]|nr:HGGxSTG domain-containing protein [Mesorhizobium sp.]